MTFKAGDRFSVQGSGGRNYGEITDVISDHYMVVWDHHPIGIFSYHKADVAMWNWESEAPKLPPGLHNALIKSNMICSHEWKNYVGLMESFEFCAKCDEKKK